MSACNGSPNLQPLVTLPKSTGKAGETASSQETGLLCPRTQIPRGGDAGQMPDSSAPRGP